MVQVLPPDEQAVAIRACNLSTLELEAGKSGVQRHPQAVEWVQYQLKVSVILSQIKQNFHHKKKKACKGIYNQQVGELAQIARVILS